MGHFSDYSYLQRAVSSSFLLLYFIWSLWSSDRFRTLSFEKIRRLELKSIICIIMIFTFPLELFYDFMGVNITYAEGYMVDPANGQIIVKPQELWTPEHQATVDYTDYIYDVCLSLEGSILFLLQCFWNYLITKIAQKPFMSSIEWKVYLVWAMITVLLTPMLQYAFSANKLYAEVIPQMAFAVDILIVSCLGFLSHARFNRFIAGYQNSKRQLKNDIIVSKLTYFRGMNAALSLCLFFTAAAILTLCIDALTPAKILNTMKESCDILICIANTSSFIVWVVLISIFFPPRSFMSGSSQHGTATDENTAVPLTPMKTGVYPYHGRHSSYSPSDSISVSTPTKSGPGIVKTVTVEMGSGPNEDSTPLRGSDYYYPA